LNSNIAVIRSNGAEAPSSKKRNDAALCCSHGGGAKPSPPTLEKRMAKGNATATGEGDGLPDRRQILLGAIAATVVSGAADDVAAQSSHWPAVANVTVRLTVNGVGHSLTLDSRSSLLDMLRERLGLTGAKKGCDHGQCGACTVHFDGRRIVSCLTLAVQAYGRQVTTIEGLAAAGELHAMQQEFIDHDALQCGNCTPGQIMAAVACVHEGHATAPEQIREYMSGNICRCGAYVGIVAAIQDAAAKMRRA
jgi:xanthine dehydrogenase YagT iron-sulfur-binding subunit